MRRADGGTDFRVYCIDIGRAVPAGPLDGRRLYLRAPGAHIEVEVVVPVCRDAVAKERVIGR